VVLIITAEYERTTQKYGERGRQYVHMEAGHAAQNICLQVESLGLGTVTVGAFEGEKLQQVLNLPSSYQPLYVMPISYPR
jgi:SagB-type dehydrogenase family enzyme